MLTTLRHSIRNRTTKSTSGNQLSWIKTFLIEGLAVLAIWGICVPTAQAEIDAATVQRSIDRGVAFLRKIQTKNGGWQEFQGHSCGQSSLCTLALLNAGVSKDDPAIVRAMQYLRNIEPNQTYSVALQTLVYCDYGAAGDLPRIRRNVKLLESLQIGKTGSAMRAGSWPYGRGRGGGDPSNAQFALLALGAAVDRGIEVAPETFELGLDYWIKRQEQDGGWSYGTDATGSMTCAGIASVIIANSRLAGKTSRVNGEQIQCCGKTDQEKDPVERALQWLGDRFSVRANPGSATGGTLYYYLYALERVGRLSGRRFIGGHDWYRTGAEQLVLMQDDLQGHWRGSSTLEPNEVATSFALLFLSKGKRQVVVARLKYSDSEKDPSWQSHPDAMRQLVRKIENTWRRDLTWQTIDAQNAELTDLLQTPLIVISGREAIRFNPTWIDRLKEYIEQGGTLLFEAEEGDGCGADSRFLHSVQQLCSQLIEGAQLEKLPPDHPVWFAQRRVDPSAIPPTKSGQEFWMYGVQACCRTSIFASPRSLSCRWELADLLFRRQRMAPTVKKQIDVAVGIGENIVAYATGRELQDKLEQRFVIHGGELPKLQRSANPLAMLAFDAGGQEARRSLENVTAMISQRVPVDLLAAHQPVGFDPKALQDVAVLWVHGQTEFQWDPQQRQVLQEYLENDGVILASAICGRPAFSESFRRELQAIFPKMQWTTARQDHPVMKVPGGYDLSEITTRKPGQRGQGVVKRRGIPPLEIGQIHGVINVFFSPLDVSCALESPNSIQCPGYGTEDAAKIVANIVLYSLQQ